MALSEPPQFVAVDLALVYEPCDDIPAELYRRLLQLIGWMYVTKKNGRDFGVTIAELSERWKISERSVYHSLQTLGATGYITINYARGRVYIRRGPKITDNRPREAADNNTLGEPATQQAARGGDTDNRPREAATAHNPRATGLHETGEVRAMPLHDDPNINVVVGSTFLEEDQQQQQETVTDAVQSACTAAGLWPDIALELERDAWATPARILGWYEHLAGMQERGEKIGGRPIGSIQALMMSHLRAHREPPAPHVQNDRRRFISGKYADCIEH
jgi:hypothetical protein